MKANLLATSLFSPLIFSTFFLATKSISAYLLTRKANKTNQKQTMKNIEEVNQLIAKSAGKFFSITFEKKDGTLRTVNAKDKYLRLIAGAKDSPSIKGLHEAGYLSAVNRNRESWFSFQPTKVKFFKCGKIERVF